MADKLRAQQQLEQLQQRYVGTGHADTTRFEWTSNIQRDSYASYVGHPPLLSYMAIGMGSPREIVRKNMIEKMIQPVGKPPRYRISDRFLGMESSCGKCKDAAYRQHSWTRQDDIGMRSQGRIVQIVMGEESYYGVNGAYI
ncbi:hypothetical protein H4I96_03651 [Botrytis cinerea]